MKLDLFADGITNISIVAGVVRIDFYVVRPKGQPTDGATSETERDTHLSINLPLPGFVSSINILQRVLNELLQRGVVSGRPPEDLPRPDA